MNYLVLARKWRPQTFEEVQGQEVIVKTLRHALNSGRLAHAFLFCGSRGTGKTTLARILAKALCCEKGVSPTPCGTCSVCVSITDGSSLDVVEIDGASNTGVDDVRELKETIRYQPTNSRFKVFIIDEVHMLSTNAFNALLKTLEEPPPHVKFILATTEPHKIPVTIHSRCQRYDLKRLKISVICDQLTRVLGKEGLRIEPDALRLIAQVADGGMRDALSLADQVLSFASDNATLADVSALLGVTSRTTVMQMTLALLNKDFESVFKIIDEIDSGGSDLRKFADSVAVEIRHLAVAKAAQSIHGLVDLSEDEVAQIDTLAKKYDLQDLQRVFSLMLEGVDQIARSEQPRLSLELICLRIADRPDAESLVSITQAISRLESLSQKHLKRELTVPATKEAEPLESAPAQAPAPTAVPAAVAPKPIVAVVSAQASGSFDERWPDFVSAVAQVNQSIGVYLEHGRPQKNAAVYFEHRFYKDRILEVCKECGSRVSWPKFTALIPPSHGFLKKAPTRKPCPYVKPARSIAKTRRRKSKKVRAITLW
jgi:DNA polymerase-3 subunit gamma/tau